MEYTLIDNDFDFVLPIKELANTDTVYLDIETSGLDPFSDKLLLVQLNINNKIYIIDCLKCVNVAFLLREIYNYKIVGHNLKFDLRFLYAKYKLMPKSVFDTMMAETLTFAGIGDKFYSLAYLINEYLKIELEKDVRETFYTQEVVEFSKEQLEYSAFDVYYLPDLHFILETNLKNVKQYKVFELEMATLPAVISMEINGVKLDVNAWKNLTKQAIDKAEAIRQEILSTAISRIDFSKFESLYELFIAFGVPVTTKKAKNLYSSIKYSDFTKEDIQSNFACNFNVASNSQILKLLNYLGIRTESTGEKTLKELHSDDPIIKLILDYRDYYKKGTSFGEKFLTNINSETGRIHSNFNQLGTDSGRFTSSAPNLQQIVKDSDYRSCFVADEGNLVITADYSQQELRIAGALTGEPRFIEAFREEKDMHTLTASLVYGIPMEEVTKEQRNKAKTLNFAILYGSSDKGLHYNFGFTLEESSVLLRRFYDSYPTLAMFKKQAEEFIQQRLFSVSLYGRRRFFKIAGMYSSSSELYADEASMKRKGFNHMIQATGADITKLALYKMYSLNPFGDSFKLIMTVHDEIVCEVEEGLVEEAMKFVEKCMLDAEQPFLKDIPAKISIKSDKCWSK